MSDNINSGKTDIIIVGAGLTGLTLGYYLKKAGKDIIMLEKEIKTGGVINTCSENGFIYETGPNTGVLSTPEIVMLFEDLKDHCKLEVADRNSKKRYILKSGKWQALPIGPVSAIRTPLFTFKDKLRILTEPFRKPGNDPDETVAQLVIRRLGKSYLYYAVDPFISGIYAGDPEKLVTRFALPKLYALEQNYGSFIRGAIAKSKEPKNDILKKTTREVFSVKGGLGNLITALTKEIGTDKIFTGCRNTVIHPEINLKKVVFTDDKDNICEFNAPLVITTTGGYTMPDILPCITSEIIKDISELTYAGIVQVAIGYHKWRGLKLDAFGGLVPTLEKRNILGILFPSAMFEGRAPKGGALLSVFLGGIRNPDIIKRSDDEITTIVMKEIADTLFNNSYPDLLKISRYHHAIPQYDKSSEARLECINRIQEQYPGLILAGNIRDGIGMADRVKQAKLIAGMLSDAK